MDPTPVDCQEEARRHARDAGLRYVRDDRPGYRRRRRGRGFSYLTPDGTTIRDPELRERFAALAIPPAWEEVWICADANGHLQATGRDARGRKQYRYHPEWRLVRDHTKFERLTDFAQRLPALRRRILRDLEREGLPRERVLAAVVQLLEETLIRVGNPEYARDNASYGLTTLRRRHATVDGARVRFEFTGKGGKRWAADADDRRVAAVVRGCQELRGQELFTYLDDDGRRQDVGSGDVNSYLREISGDGLSAKDFRTWGGTVCAATHLFRNGADPAAASNGAGQRQIAEAVRAAAERLGNTPATCRKYYVHPGVLEAFGDPALHALGAGPSPPDPRGLDADERFTLELLRRIEGAEEG